MSQPSLYKERSVKIYDRGITESTTAAVEVEIP